MRAYAVTVEIPGPDDEEGGSTTVTVKQYAATMADARTTRQAFVNDYGVMKKEVEISETDIPTAKPALLAFINELL